MNVASIVPAQAEQLLDLTGAGTGAAASAKVIPASAAPAA